MVCVCGGLEASFTQVYMHFVETESATFSEASHHCGADGVMWFLA